MVGIEAVLGIGSKLIDRLWPDPQQAQEAKLKLLEMQQNGELAELDADVQIALAQIRVNEKQAESGSLFVSGGRPFIIWVCGVTLAYHFILRDFMLFFTSFFVETLPNLPQLAMSELMPVLLGLLGLGTMRTAEKIKGVARSKL